MSCNTCQAKFSFFTKEVGCAKCGFSYCTKCLKYKHNIPNVGERKICGRCYNRLQAEARSPPVVDSAVPDGLEQPLAPIDMAVRVESLENPSRAPITMYRQRSKLDKLRADLDPADQEIVNRLKKLKDEDKQVPLPTEDEIRRRLALLKDQDPDKVYEPLDVNKVDTRTDQQKTDDLINEYLDRLNISKTNDAMDQDIRARLDNLRGIDSSKYSQQNIADMEEDDDETATKKLIKKALAEAALDIKFDDVDEVIDVEGQASGLQQTNPTSHDCSGCTGKIQCPNCFNNSHDEFLDLESCVMCEQTTNLVTCKGCNDDLYCQMCFEDNHDDFEMHKHKTVPFKPRKISSD